MLAARLVPGSHTSELQYFGGVVHFAHTATQDALTALSAPASFHMSSAPARQHALLSAAQQLGEVSGSLSPSCLMSNFMLGRGNAEIPAKAWSICQCMRTSLPAGVAGKLSRSKSANWYQVVLLLALGHQPKAAIYSMSYSVRIDCFANDSTSVRRYARLTDVHQHSTGNNVTSLIVAMLLTLQQSA